VKINRSKVHILPHHTQADALSVKKKRGSHIFIFIIFCNLYFYFVGLVCTRGKLRTNIRKQREQHNNHQAKQKQTEFASGEGKRLTDGRLG
jgi:cytochrome bd-type quinol oxidase subunit 1